MSLDEQDFNISEDYPLFITPNYKNDIEDFTFNSEKEFDQWFQENIRKHGKFCYHGQYNHKVDKSLVGLPVFLPVKTLSYTCAHGYRRKKEEPAEETETALKKRKLTRKSIKVGCTAKYSKIYICNGQIKVKYNWKHVNHDPTDPREIIQSRLPTEIREWIEKKVTEGLDWKAIKSLLPARPLSLEQLEESNKSNIKFPAASLIKYQDVKNIINKVSRKHPDEQLKEREEARLVELTGAYNNLKKTVIEEMDLPVFQDIEDRKKKIADIESLIHNMKGFINTLEKARNTTAQAEPSGQS